MSDPQPGDDLSDAQLWLGTVVFRWLPFSLELLGIAVAIAAIAWAISGGVQHYLTSTLKVAGGLAAGWFLWWLADVLHPISRNFDSTFHAARERRERTKDTRGYFLFLRSFRDDAFAVRNTITTEGRTTTVAIDNLSDLLEWGLAPYGRFIMIGTEPTADPFTDASVMARTDDASWWSAFERLLANARCVFLVPETSAGLMRELTAVLNEPYRSKAIIVMPRADAQGHRAKRWEEVRAVLAGSGLDLPPYDPAGCFYMPDEQLRAISTFSFGTAHSVSSAMRHAFRRIEAVVPRGTTPFKEALGWIDLADGQFPTDGREGLNRSGV